MAFLADGNARLADGTFIKTWLSVHTEMRNAEMLGVPLSEAARTAIVKMGTAEKAIKAASASAKLAAQRAADEYAAEKGAKVRLSHMPVREETSTERARKLAEEAARLAEEAAEKERARVAALQEMEEAKLRSRLARWRMSDLWQRRPAAPAADESGGSGVVIRRAPTNPFFYRANTVSLGQEMAINESPEPSCLSAFCCCLPLGPMLSPGSSTRVMPPPPSPLPAPPNARSQLLSPGSQIQSPSRVLLQSPNASSSPRPSRSDSPARTDSPRLPGAAGPPGPSPMHCRPSASGVPSFRGNTSGGGMNQPPAGSSSAADGATGTRPARAKRAPSEELQQRTLEAMKPRVKRYSFNDDPEGRAAAEAAVAAARTASARS